MNAPKKRVLIFSLVYYPRNIGGAEVAVKEITDRIPPSDIEFDMITLRKHAPAYERIGNVNVYRVGMPWRRGGATGSSRILPLSKLLYPFMAYRMALKLHRAKPYDATWSIMASYAGYAAMLFKRAYPSVPHVLTIQEGDHFGLREGMLKPLFRSIFRSADRIQSISTFLEVWSRQMGATCPIDVVPNGVDYENFSRSHTHEARMILRKELGISDSDKVIVTSSRLVEKNAVDDIISALSHLDPTYKFLCIGAGADEAKLKSQAERLGVVDRVIWKGFVPHAELPRYIDISDVFVRPSRTEGLGNSFLEAMAAGIPVVATPVGGIPDFLTDGETGLFCEVDNPRSIAQKVEKLVKDRESRDYIVGRAREMVQERYQWGSIAKKMADILMR